MTIASSALKTREIVGLAVVCLFWGIALGGWLMLWLGRWMDRPAQETRTAEMAAAREEAERNGYDRGYTAALGVRTEIDMSRQRKER